jgi:transcriptional regulator with XRE-family HTH domain
VADEARPGGSEARFRGELRVVIRRARERLKMSQGEFARALGAHLGHPISQSQISDWERGRFEPAASVLLAVAEMAGMSVDELRGAGPPALIERLDRVEREVEVLLLTGPAAEAEPGVDGTLVDRVASIEHELKTAGELMARMIKVFENAGLWPTRLRAT